MTGKYKIDSFSLLIPRGLVTVIDPTFEQEYIKYFPETETKEENDFYKNHFTISREGYNIKMQSLYKMWNGINEKFIKIVVTSKFLEEDYFNGIDASNAGKIVDVIASMNVITFDEETYFKSYFTDLDICIDLQVNEEGQYKIKDYYKDSVIEPKRKHIRTFRSSPTNLQMNERGNTSTPASPFLKFYNKSEELTSKSLDFYNAYLLPQSEIIKVGIYRVEVTVKDSKHKQRLGIKECSIVSDLFSLKQSDLERIHKSVLNEYIKATKRVMKTSSDLKPTDRMLLNAINFLVTLEQGEEMILERLINGLTSVEKSRQKKRIMTLFENITDNDKLNLNDERQKVLITHLKTLGIFGTD
jgi:hypothetical protein